MPPMVGVLGLQGAVRPHLAAISGCGAVGRLVRLPDEIREADALIVPGGESTTIGMLIERFGIREAIEDHAAQGKPILGTCAGMILLAKDIAGSQQPRLGMMDVRVVRNSYGRQVDSFEAAISIPILGETPFPGVFIRAPHVERVAENVEVLGVLEGRIVLAKQANLLAASFHPELTNDLRLHQYFLSFCGA